MCFSAITFNTPKKNCPRFKKSSKSLLMLKTIENIIIACNLALSLACFYSGIKNRKKHFELSHLFIYSFASFIQTLLMKSLEAISKIDRIKHIYIYNKSSIQAFILIEFLSIYFFFYKNKSFVSSIKRLLLCTSIFFLISFILYFNANFSIFHMTYFYYFESVIILMPCFIYLYQLFLKPPTLDLLQEPSFWFTSGILIYFTLTLPLFLIVDNLQDNYFTAVINIINSIGYIVIFSFLFKAYKCRIQTVK